MPAGKRRTGLAAALEDLLARLFGPRVLPFDQQAAKAFAPLVLRARAAGHAISVGDGQIAAIAAARKWPVATRDTIPFIAAGVSVINPWQDVAA